MSYSTSSIEGVQKSVPIFVRGLALDSGLGIVFDGSGPGYDRQAHTIHFPKYASFSSDRLKVDPSLSEVQAAVDDLFKAVGLHEIGHPLYTSPGHSHGEDLAHGLFWSLEDIRCDSFSQGRLAGGSRIFDAGYRRLISMGYWIPLKDSASAEDIFQAWVLFQGRHLLARQAAFADLGNGAELLLEQFAGKPFVQGAWQILLKLKTTTSSWDVVPIVDELLKYLKQSASPQSQGSASDKSGQSSAGDDDPSSPDDSGSNSVPSRSLPDPTDGQPAKPSGDGSGSDEQPSSKRSSTETSAPSQPGFVGVSVVIPRSFGLRLWAGVEWPLPSAGGILP